MFKEVTGIEALNAALDGKQVLQIYIYVDDDLMIEDLTEKIIDILGRKNARYLIDVSGDKAKREPKPVQKAETREVPESIEYALAEEKAQHLGLPHVTPIPEPRKTDPDQKRARAVQEEPEAEQNTEKAEQNTEKAEQTPEKTEQAPENISGSKPESGLAKKRGRYKTGVDVGKIMALHEAGWTNVKIGEEMFLTPQTIARYIRNEEEKKNGAT